jgi:Domain of unknown function (DUF397)
MDWIKSSRCADNACVEVARVGDGMIGLRDSKGLEQPFLRFDQAAWSAFVEGIKAGDFSGR